MTDLMHTVIRVTGAGYNQDTVGYFTSEKGAIEALDAFLAKTQRHGHHVAHAYGRIVYTVATSYHLEYWICKVKTNAIL